MLKKPSTSSKDQINGYGAGRPFFIPERYPILKNDFQRQQAIVIELSDLNGAQSMPHTFLTKRGRVLPSFERYWSPADFAMVINTSEDIA